MNKKVQCEETDIISHYREHREIRFSTLNKYIKDVNKLSYKTDQKGNFIGKYELVHNTPKKEKAVFYAYLEGSTRPLAFIANHAECVYHLIDMPAKGQKVMDFKIENLPKGKHILYFL